MTTREKIILYIHTWEGRGYAKGLPDEVESKLEASGRVPTYKRICIALMKNDVTLSSLGYTRPKCRIYDILKKEELLRRGNTLVQLTLF